MRKINKYIANLKRKLTPNKSICIKEFKDVVLTKLIAVADKKYDEKLDVKENQRNKTEKLSLAIKLALVKVSTNQDDYFGHVQNGTANDQYRVQEQLFKNIQEFCRNCKRKKGKKKDEDQAEPESQMINESQMVYSCQNIQNIPSAEMVQSSKAKAENSKQQPFKKIQSEDDQKIGRTFEDLNLRKAFLKAAFDKSIEEKIILAPFLKDEQQIRPHFKPRLSQMSTHQRCSFQDFIMKNKDGPANQIVNHLVDFPVQNDHLVDKKKFEQNPLSFFQNIPSVLQNVDFQKTDQNSKLPDGFKIKDIFLQTTFNPLENSNNNLSLSSSLNYFGQKSNSLGFLSRSRNLQNPFDLNLPGHIYTSSSNSSNTNKQEKCFEICQSTQKNERKQQKQNLQMSAQNFQLSQSFQLDDFLRRKSQLPN